MAAFTQAAALSVCGSVALAPQEHPVPLQPVARRASYRTPAATAPRSIKIGPNNGLGHPGCAVEQRLHDLKQSQAAIQLESLRLSERISARQDRGSGRISAETGRGSGRLQARGRSDDHRDDHRGDRRGRARYGGGATPSRRRATFKLLAVGPRHAVTQHIQTLHTLGYANVDDWSPAQPGPKPGEVTSILIRPLSRLRAV